MSEHHNGSSLDPANSLVKAKATPRHFVDLHRLEADTLKGMIAQARALKEARIGMGRGALDERTLLTGRLLAMIFERPSTRTRVSFDVAMRQMGGDTLLLNSHDLQLGRGETVADTARTLSRYVDGIVLRTGSHQTLCELADHASVPVINALSDFSHPCQIMADIMTFEEHRGPITNRVIAWSGDGNNVAQSWIDAACRFDFELRLACPAELNPDAETLRRAKREGARVSVTNDPEIAVRGADCVVADTWVSMHQDETEHRHNLLAPYQVNQRLMNLAKPDALFMHCLPAKRGQEVTADVIDGPNSVVWDEAENRLHAQKGILAWCLG
jgi:ornithine carbamoyltransferase